MYWPAPLKRPRGFRPYCRNGPFQAIPLAKHFFSKETAGLRDVHTVAPGKVNEELPCHTARTRTSGSLPFNSFGA